MKIRLGKLPKITKPTAVGQPPPMQAPMPPMQAPIIVKLPVPVKAPPIGSNLADVGDTGVRQYSGVEKGVQATEAVDSVISNTGAAAGAAMRTAALVARFAPSAANMAQTFNVAKAVPVLNVARVAGSKLAPVQAALWGLDAGRAVLDPEYRKETLASTNALLDDPSQGDTQKSFGVAANTLARPISTTGALLRSYRDSSDRIASAEQEIARSDAKLDALKKARREGTQRQEADDVRRYIQVVARDTKISDMVNKPITRKSPLARE